MEHNLGNIIKNIAITSVGCTKEELIEWYNNNDIINNFIGCVEVTKDFLEQDVPESFSKSQIHDFETVNEATETTIINNEGIEEVIETTTETKNLLYTTDEEDNEIPLMRQMKWYEYGGKDSSDKFIESINNKYILMIGKRELPYCNRFNKVSSEEFYEWVNYFGIENVYTKSETYTLILKTETRE